MKNTFSEHVSITNGFVIIGVGMRIIILVYMINNIHKKIILHFSMLILKKSIFENFVVNQSIIIC